MTSKTTTRPSAYSCRRFFPLRQMPLLGALTSCIALAGGIHNSGDGDVLIDTTGAPAIVTSGEKDHGIWGQSNDGGNVSITNGSAITTAGNNAYGVHGASDGSVTILNSNVINTEGQFGHGILASGNGVLMVENQADIYTKGNAAHGIRVAPGEGDATIRNTGNITLEGNALGYWSVMAGISAESYSSGAVNIYHDGDIFLSGYGAGGGGAMGLFGIFTHTRGSAASTITASGNITVTGNAPVDAPVSPYQTGIENRAEYGVATINYSGGILTASGTTGTRGLVAWSSNTSTGTKAEVNVGIDGRMTEVNAYGAGSFGVLASSGQNTVRIGGNASVLGNSGVQLQGVQNTVVNDGRITSAGSGKAGLTVYAYRGNGTADVVNTGVIEGHYGLILSNAAGDTVMDGGSIYNSGVIRSTQGEDGLSVYLKANNIDVTLDTGSNLTGAVYSNGIGNTITLNGTNTEDSYFVANNEAAKFTMTVENNGAATADWTLNGSRSQLDGVGAITIRNAPGANATTPASKLTIRPSEAGDYTFGHALSGDGRLRLELTSATDHIRFSENTGSAFAGTVELGVGTFLMGGTAGSEGYWNAVAVSNSRSGLLIDSGNRFVVTGEQGIGSGGLTINDGAIFELVFDAETGASSSLAMDGGLLTIHSGASLVLAGADNFAASEDMVFDIITGADSLTVQDGAFSEGTIYQIGGIDFYIHHSDNGIYLSTAAAVPEPATWALLIAGFSLALAYLRRRKQR